MTTKPQPAPFASKPARFDWNVHLVFVLCGVVTTLLGPLVPTLMVQWSLSHTQIGTFFTCQFLGALGGNLVGVALIPRAGLRRTMALGTLCMAVGVLALGHGSALAGMASVALYGVGNGLAVPAGNLLVARAPLSQRAGALSFLNFVWGLGAVATSPLLAVWASYGDWRWLSAGFACILLLLASRVALQPSRARLASPHDHNLASGQQEASSPVPAPAGYWPQIVIFAIVLVLYVSTENTIGGWAATHAREIGMSAALSTIMPGIFYGSLVAIRGIAPWLFRLVPARRAAEAGLALAVIGSAMLVSFRHPWAIALSLVMLGAGLATVFPTLLAIFAEVAGPRTERIGPTLFAMTNVGASLMLASVGMLMDKTGSSSQALLLPGLAQIVLLVLLLCRIPRPSGQVSSETVSSV